MAFASRDSFWARLDRRRISRSRSVLRGICMRCLYPAMRTCSCRSSRGCPRRAGTSPGRRRGGRGS
jgi:hypothetical protein